MYVICDIIFANRFFSSLHQRRFTSYANVMLYFSANLFVSASFSSGLNLLILASFHFGMYNFFGPVGALLSFLVGSSPAFAANHSALASSACWYAKDIKSNPASFAIFSRPTLFKVLIALVEMRKRMYRFCSGQYTRLYCKKR